MDSSDSIYLNEVQQIFNHVNSYKFKKPLIFKITDPLLKNDKVIALNNEENIPRLLEVVTFSQNHNFRLVYEKSIVNSGECEHPIPIESEQSIPV